VNIVSSKYVLGQWFRVSIVYVLPASALKVNQSTSSSGLILQLLTMPSAEIAAALAGISPGAVASVTEISNCPIADLILL